LVDSVNLYFYSFSRVVIWFKGVNMYKIIVLSLLVSACASVRGSNVAQPEQSADETTSQKGLIVSGTEMSILGSKHFINLDFSIENGTNKYINIKKISLDFGSPEMNSQFQIVTGKDLLSWADATQQNVDINNHNVNMILTSVYLAGITVAATSNNEAVAIAGLATSTGALAVGEIRDFRNHIQNLERSQLYPNNAERTITVPYSHLAAGNFSVPPALHTKKWVTLYAQNAEMINKVKGARMIIEYGDGQKENFKLNWRRSI
jgi:hypothetical protein